MSGTTAELGLATATDTDDIEVYGVSQLAAALVVLDALFSSSAGHDHSAAHRGKPIPTSGLAQPLALTSPVLATPTLTTPSMTAPTVTGGGLTVSAGNTSLAAHLLGTGAAPTAAAGAAAGSSPPAPVVAGGSTDLRGLVTFGSGTTPAAGAVVVVTLNQPFGAPPIVVVSGYNANSQLLGAFCVDNIDTQHFTVRVSVAPSASQGNGTYAFNYIVIG